MAQIEGEIRWRAEFEVQDNGRMQVWELGALEITGPISWGGGVSLLAPP